MVSHSFIRREIQALEREGIEVTRIAVRGWDHELKDPEDLSERTQTRYVLGSGAVPLFTNFLRALFVRPVRLAKAFALAFKMAKRADRPLYIHLIYLLEACRILPWLLQAKIDHLHAHFGTNSAEVAMYAHVLGGPDWSFTVHGPEEFDKAEFIGLAEKIRQSAFVVAISSFGRSQLFRLIEFSLWSKVHVIHCGLETPYFEGPSIPLTPTPRLVCVGRLCEQKGQLLLLEAVRRLVLAKKSVQLVLAGDGEMRSEIEAFIQENKLAHSVRITGWISSQQVREEISAARALVLPSFAEGLPVVIMEAMAMKRPVISTFVAGIPELLHSGIHGWLVPAGDVDALEKAIIACLDSSVEDLEKMGGLAHARVFARHNVAVEAKRLAALFRHSKPDQNQIRAIKLVSSR